MGTLFFDGVGCCVVIEEGAACIAQNELAVGSCW